MLFHQSANSSSNFNYNTAFYTDCIWEYHFHKNLELIYVIRGAVNCTVNDKPYRLTQGEFGLCLPYDIHRYEPESDTQYWVLVFSEDFVRYFSKKIINKVGDGYVFHLKDSVKDYIIAQLINNESLTVFTLKSCLYAVCEEYLNSIKLVDKNRSHAEAISAIVDYVAENHTKKITLSDIAKELGYDYNYMSRHFKNIFNITFTDFINIYRLETAIKLLDDTNNSITDIAFESGFQSVRSFHSFFKKTMEISPAQYRKASRK